MVWTPHTITFDGWLCSHDSLSKCYIFWSSYNCLFSFSDMWSLEDFATPLFSTCAYLVLYRYFCYYHRYFHHCHDLFSWGTALYIRSILMPRELSVTPHAYGTPFLHLRCLIHYSCRPLVPNFPGVWSASPWARAALANPHDRPEGIMMLHAEFGPDSLITVTVRKEQRNRYFWFYVYKMDISVVIGKIFIHMHVRFPLPSNRHHLSSDACLEDKSEDNQNCSVLCCVQQLCTVIRTHVWSSYIFAC